MEELNLSSNLLETLPDSIGLLFKLKVLDVSGNKLTSLPDSICHCRLVMKETRYFAQPSFSLHYCGLYCVLQVIGGAECGFQQTYLFANKYWS